MSLQERLKAMLIKELNITDLTPEDIREDDPLFGEGVGLDSLDAVELVMLVQKHFGVQIADMDEGKRAFTSLGALAAFIEERRAQ